MQAKDLPARVTVAVRVRNFGALDRDRKRDGVSVVSTGENHVIVTKAARGVQQVVEIDISAGV